jgi:hypothetical protein
MSGREPGKAMNNVCRTPLGAFFAVLLIHAMPASSNGRASAQSKPLEVVPIVGHWELHSEASDVVVTVDATKWKQDARPDVADIGGRLFKAPAPAFVTNATSRDAFPIAAVRAIENFTSGTVRVHFKMIAGQSDQFAGLAFNLRETGEYHAVRYNTKDGNVAIWKYADGARARVAEGTTHAQLPLGSWHELVLHVVDRKATGVVNGKLQVEYTLESPVSGRIGFWAKRDSVSAFKALRVEREETPKRLVP